MGTTPKWERGAHLELSTDEKLDYLYSRDDAQQDEIDANKVKVTPATYPEGTETYNIATIKVGNTTKTLKGKEGGGGSGLPAVTSSDNGDVLTVVNGAWAKAEPSGGVYVVNAVTDEQTQITTLDKTFLEIETAFLAGKTVIVYSTEFKASVAEVGRFPDDPTFVCGVYVPSYSNTDYYHATSLDGYPFYDPND